MDNFSDRAVTAPLLQEMKAAGARIAVLTAYDYPTARLEDDSGIDVILVGDSVGNVVLGYANTLPVTMDDMLHHVKAVSRGVRRAMLVADMPYLSYQISKEQAIANAGRFLKEAGAHAVKLEGGAAVADTVADLVACGIPVMAHVGMTPQSIHLFGGYRKQARTEEGVDQLVKDTLLLEEAGAFSVVLELVPPAAAKRVTEALRIPTIGIGAGPHCDGQVLVVHDMLGMDERFAPKHARRYLELHDLLRKAFQQYAEDVRGGEFPSGGEGVANAPCPQSR